MNEICTVLFNGHDFRFLRPVIEYFKNHLDYHVLLDEHPGHIITDTQKSAELLEEANIIFCEWCLGNAEWYSQHKKRNQILIIRLHHQELSLNYIDKISWENVDGIIFICQNNLRIFLERFPNLADKARLIYNPIDCQSFDTPKMYGAEFNLGFIGLSPKRKAPHRAIEMLNQFKKIDERFTLFFKGKLPWEYGWLWKQPEERQYYEEFFLQIACSEYRNSIVFDTYSEDMPTWYSKIGFILSTSDHEGSHQAVSEGMASGAIPLIRNWAGAELIYPAKFVYETLEDAKKLLMKYKSSENYRKETILVKDYACENFDQTKITPAYEQLFEQFFQSKIDYPASVTIQPEHPLVVHTAKGLDATDLKVMHVCYINPRIQDGYVTRVIEETRVLNNAGVKIILACFLHRDYFSWPDQISEHLDFLQSYTGAFVHLIPVKDFFSLSALSQGCIEITSPIIDIANYYNVRLLHSQSIYSTLYALQANKQIKAKLVVDLHGIAVEEAEMVGEHPRRIDFLNKSEKEILRSADLMIFVSSRMKDHYEDKFKHPFGNSIIIPTCVQSEKFEMTQEIRSNKRKELGLQDKFVILYLGTLSEWQWPEAMISLFAQIHNKRPDALLILLLPQSDHLKARQFLEAQHLPPKSYIIREVPHSEVGSLIGIADSGLLLRKAHPVNYVSSPTKFGEYMAAGIPVITTRNIGDFSQIIQEENLGLVLSLDSEQISSSNLESVSQFMDDVQENRVSWAERCSQYSRTRLDWGVYGNLLQEAYRRLLRPAQGKS